MVVEGMRSPRRAIARFVLSVLLGHGLTACAVGRTLTRPEGDGGWSLERRRGEVEQLATSAGVDLGSGKESAASSPAPGPATPSSGEKPDAAAKARPDRATDGSENALQLATTKLTQPLDLPSALTLAGRGNRRIAEAKHGLDAAGERVMDVRGRLLPGTNVSSRYTWYTDAQTTKVDLPPNLFPPGTPIPVVTVRDAQNGTVNALVGLPIDLTGELWHSLAAAQAGYRGEQARVWAVTLEQELEVVRAYFELLEAIRLREVAVDTVGVYRKQLGIAQDRYDNGRLTKNDLLTFEVARRNAEQRVFASDVRIERARLALNDAIGVEVNRATSPVDVRVRPNVPPADEALRLTYEHNPLLLSLLEEQQRLDETLVSLERSRFPRFGGGGAVDYQTSDLLQPPQIGSGFVGLTWDLGTDLRRESQISAARIETERNRLATERQMRELEAAVRTTRLSAEERIVAYDTAQTAVSQADENLRIRQQQFDVGRAQSDDVLIAENLLTSQRATLASALYQAHIRRAELQRLMGLPIADLGVGSGQARGTE